MADFPLLNEASLVMIPGATKEGKVYSQVPTDGSGDFTFTRSTSATRVNADGNIEKETQNLLTHSDDLTNADWQKINSATYNGTETDPNGGSKAYSFTGGSTNSAIRQTNSLSGGVYTFSVYLKSPTNAPINIRLDSNNGTFENYPCALTTAWQRFEFYYVHNSSTLSAWIGGGLSWTTGEEVHIAFPQLEQGLVARDYIETTTTALYGGITDNTPRLDYTDSSCPALLLEPLRTNFIDHSEYGGGWAAIDANITKTDNATTSPEGVDNAVKLEGLTGSGGNQIVNFGTTALNATNVVGKTYTGSVYIKPVNPSDVGQDITFSIQRNSGDFEALNVTFEIDSADWKRYDLTYTFTGAGAGNQVGANFKILRADTTIDDIYLWGVQLEEGSYPTSYIPTYGSSVSRVDDLFELRDVQTNGLVTSTQGTMFFHITDIEGNAVVYNIQTLNDLSYALRFVVKDSGFLIYQRVNNVQTQLFNTNSLSLSEWKIAMSWNGTSLITSVNGTSYIYTIDASIASQLDKIARVNPQAMSVTTNQILVFPTQLTEADLNALTTL